jgi:hypothetical protein
MFEEVKFKKLVTICNVNAYYSRFMRIILLQKVCRVELLKGQCHALLFPFFFNYRFTQFPQIINVSFFC